MPIVNHADGDYWVPTLFGEGVSVFNTRKRAILVSGASLAGKSRAIQHRLMRHLWELDGSRVAFFAKTIKVSKEGGAWTSMTGATMKEWQQSGIGLEFTTFNSEGVPGPKTSGDSRTPFFKIRNRHGSESTAFLFSLDHDADIESKIKEMEFSAIYFSELDKFKDRRVLSICLPRLRMNFRYDDQFWIADTNPAEEETDSWIYDVWYRERVEPYDKYQARCVARKVTPMSEHIFLEQQNILELIEMFVEDNPLIDKRQIEELEMLYSYDPSLLARYRHGKWNSGTGDERSHFKGCFNKEIHVLGDINTGAEDDWQVILPTPNMIDLVTGWDIGDVNHAMVFIEAVTNPTICNGRPCFAVLDELESVGAFVSLEAFTEAALEILDKLEAHLGHPLDTSRAWSDNSSLIKYNAAAGLFPYQQVAASSKGRFALVGVAQLEKSIRLRVQLIKLLLKQNRLIISANCIAVIRMLTKLKKGKNKAEFVHDDENVHIFDALTYALIKECIEEMMMIMQQQVGQRPVGAEVMALEV